MEPKFCVCSFCSITNAISFVKIAFPSKQPKAKTTPKCPCHPPCLHVLETAMSPCPRDEIVNMNHQGIRPTYIWYFRVTSLYPHQSTKIVAYLHAKATTNFPLRMCTHKIEKCFLFGKIICKIDILQV